MKDNKKRSEKINLAASIILPDRCCLCGKPILYSSEICDECRKSAEVISYPKCSQCGKSKKDCKCKGRANFYTAVTAPFEYRGLVRRGITAWKYNDARRNTDFFAKTVAAAVKKDFIDENGAAFDFITFVPQTEKETKQRGYNQSEKLAESVGQYLKLPVCAAVRKITETKRQHDLPSHLKSGNVFGVFDCRRNINLDGKTVLLIDDIKTSGSTLNECAKMLLLSGASAVYCAAAAIA